MTSAVSGLLLDMRRSIASEVGQPLRMPHRDRREKGSDRWAARVGAAGVPNGPDDLHEKHLRQGTKPSTDSILFGMIDSQTVTGARYR